MQFKQKSLHRAVSIWSQTAFYCVVWIFCIAPAPRSGVEAQTMARKPGDQVARLRLIAAPRRPDGGYDAGVEIALPPGAHTYWTQPGEAGVPPVFSFNGSQNVAKAEVRFPVPQRLSEDGLDAFGYTGTVVFPVVVSPADRGKPSLLKADVSYAVCDKICVPAHGDAVLSLAPGGSDPDAAAVDAALALVPLPIDTTERDNLKIVPLDRGAKPAWRVTWTGARPLEDLFAIAPEGFYFSTRRSSAGQDFVLTAEQVVTSGASTRVPVTLVLKRVGGSLSTIESLDVGAISR